MSKELTNDEKLKSISAINFYRQNNPGTLKKRVVVRNCDKIIFNDEVSVIAGDYNIYFKVDIIWEDANFDFRNNGLYGYYSSTYNKVIYDGNVMTIYSNTIIIDIM